MIAKKRVNSLAELRGQLQMFNIIRRDEIPQKHKPSVINDLPLWLDLEKLRQLVEREGIAPYEEALNMNLSDPRIRKLLVNQKGQPLRQARQAIATKMRQWLKKSGMVKYLDIIWRGDVVSIAGKGGDL